MKRRMTADSVLMASPDQVSADLPADLSAAVVILGLKDGNYFELNEVGARVWHLIQQPRSIRSVIGAITDEYEVLAEQCEKDVLDLAGEMLQRGLIVIVDEPDS
jgi:hypothetical protein